MNRTEAVAQVQEVLGFRSDLTDRIITQIGITSTRLQMGATKPWWTIEQNKVLFTTEANTQVNVPEDFLEEYEEGRFQISDGEGGWSELIKNDLDELISIYGRTETGLPEGYALVGRTFQLYPVPDAEYVLHLDYIKSDDPLTSGSSTNGYLTYIPELIIGMAGLRIAQAIRDKEAITTFREMVQEGRLELYRQNESRKHSNANYQMGGAH
jgi:hypothetical protein